MYFVWVFMEPSPTVTRKLSGVFCAVFVRRFNRRYKILSTKFRSTGRVGQASGDFSLTIGIIFRCVGAVVKSYSHPCRSLVGLKTELETIVSVTRQDLELQQAGDWTGLFHLTKQGDDGRRNTNVASMRSCEAFIFIGDSGIGIFLGASRS
jgi:hypothetical protein